MYIGVNHSIVNPFRPIKPCTYSYSQLLKRPVQTPSSRNFAHGCEHTASCNRTQWETHYKFKGVVALNQLYDMFLALVGGGGRSNDPRGAG